MKPKNKIITPQSPSMGPDVGENDLFPRCQYPDERTSREAWLAIEQKLNLTSKPRKWYPAKKGLGYRKPVKCITTGEEFAGLRQAAIAFDLNNANLCLHLKGEIPHVKGLRFSYL